MGKELFTRDLYLGEFLRQRNEMLESFKTQKGDPCQQVKKKS